MGAYILVLNHAQQMHHACNFAKAEIKCAMQMIQIELEQSEEYIKQLKEKPEQDQLRVDNKVIAAVNAKQDHTCNAIRPLQRC